MQVCDVWDVCVCETSEEMKNFQSISTAGGQCTTDSHCPTKTLSVRGDMESDQLHVPASPI